MPAGDGGEASLYLRPFMFASEAFLGVRPATEVTYCVIASPAGPYFAGGLKPVSIWLSTAYTRAAPGGTGAAKCGGNYAASLAAQVEASANGCDQVAFLDAVERRWVEELGGMNLYFVHRDGSIVTPELTGTILEGVTRSSILELAEELGHPVKERRISIEEWREGVGVRRHHRGLRLRDRRGRDAGRPPGLGRRRGADRGPGRGRWRRTGHRRSAPGAAGRPVRTHAGHPWLAHPPGVALGARSSAERRRDRTERRILPFLYLFRP